MGLQLVERMANVSMKPDTTLRRYLTLLGANAGPIFAELTFLAERSLYSYHPIGDHEASQAEEMLSVIPEEIKRETI